jgi:hypothetical protein
VSQRNVCELVERFQGGRSSDDVDDARSGRPSTDTCVEVKKQIYQRIRENRRIIID